MNTSRSSLLTKALVAFVFFSVIKSPIILYAHHSKTIVYGPHDLTLIKAHPKTTLTVFDVDDTLLKRFGDFKKGFVNPFEFDLTAQETNDVKNMNEWFNENCKTFIEKTDFSEQTALDFVARHHPIINNLVVLKNDPTATPVRMRDYFFNHYIGETNWFGSNDVIRQLHKNGYKVALGTNVHKTTTEALFNSPASPLPFDQFFYVHTSDSTPYENDKLIKKPATAYNQSMINACFAKMKKNMPNAHEDYLFVFVDDKMKNVEAVVNEGQGQGFKTIGVQYVSEDQLVKDFKELGFPLN